MKKNIRNNYDYTKEKIRPEFLKYDQEEMVRRFSLNQDGEYLYIDFVGNVYGINKKTGEVKRISQKQERMEKEEADYEEVLSIYDILCYGKKNATLSGRWCLVNSLPGVGQNSGVGDNTVTDDASYIDTYPEIFEKVCKSIKGQKISWGDIGYEIPVFPFFPVRLRFYHGDEEFPAQLSILFDEHTLDYMHYETTYYVAACLLRTIRRRMEKAIQGEKESC